MRVKRGFASRRRHKKLLKRAEGFRGRRKSSFKIAKRAVERAQTYSYRDRKGRARDFRALWNVRIGAAAKELGFSYSRLINGLKQAKIELNRKMLAHLAMHDGGAFKAVLEQARAALAA